ncbi:unnamed protein product [Trichogramma brassicae]|uniref:Calponin-homology (CH) domain-containing protein n=1 Tax=Trichogramma brassicae TaxID=86971 RepID=A0A6H5J520_9HYME|nr:unnamed protein product [Trichogramma brassicae]
MSEVQKQITRNLQRTLEDAHISGELKLGSRKLKEFPKNNCSSTKLNLQDLVFADLSKNRLIELPEEITEFVFLEKLYLNQNAIKCIPETVLSLQSLSYLDISRNQLLTLPKEICHLPLQTLIVSYNRLSSLPEDLNLITTLAELDAGHNELRNLPYRIGDISTLKYLDLQLMSLKLWKLDISGNRISVLPNELRKMTSLVSFKVHDNPLTSPPAALCVRGQIHIFKYLERQAEKYERLKSVKGRNNDFTETRHQNDSQSLLHWPPIDCENVGKTYPEEDNSTDIESRLKINLSEDLASALMDGVILCHLANFIKPRSIASIHVPSAAVPKLSMARCRRNVDNFLDACRKNGVNENFMCCASDVLEGGRGIVRLAVTISEILKLN